MLPSGARTNLFDLSQAQLEAWFAQLGEPSFRASQLMRWVYHKGVLDFADMTSFSKDLRQRMAECGEFLLPDIESEEVSVDGTRKWMLAIEPGKCVEMVFIPEAHRGTLCISSQVGCALECAFCATGRQGFAGNLACGQITGQVYLARERLRETDSTQDRSITNVVFMGMGEPLLNFDNVLAAADLMMSDFGFGLSRRRVTVSTAGVVPAIHSLAEHSNVSLAVSLHAPDDTLRDILVPLNRKYPIAQLMDACRLYNKALGRGRVVTIEYVLLRNVNDTDGHLRALIRLLKDLPCKVNLIPFNAFAGSGYEAPSKTRVRFFAEGLLKAGLRVTVRTTRGADIAAACGQLAGRFTDRTKRRLRHRQLATQTLPA